MATKADSQEGQDKLMRRYLLGELPESEQVTLEEQYFSDSERLDEVWAVENQLVDDYARGKLSSKERKRFESHYLASPRHRERVAFARMLMEAADEEAADAGATTSSWSQRLIAALRGPQLAWGLSLAALLLIVAGGVWFLSERARLQNQLAAMRSERAATQERERRLAEQIAAERQQNDQLTAELEQLRERQTAAVSEPPRPTIFSFLLPSSLMRGGGEPQSLTIPRDADQVELRMRLEANDYRSYQAVIRTVEGAEVFSSQNIKPRASRNSATVSVKAPATKLSAGDYILTLSGVNSAVQAEEVNRYFFRVVR
ncbi:MAG: hypothetical protein AB7U82_09760 [Blastocatellales bacterium]